MLRFVIGLGLNSLSGTLVDRALSDIYSQDDFEIVPLIESEEQFGSSEKLQARAVEFAKRAKFAYPAEAYFGVTGAKVKFRFVKDGPGDFVRGDMVATIVNGRSLTPHYLHPADISWQLRARVCAHVSTDKAISDLVTLIRKHCTIKALPKPF